MSSWRWSLVVAFVLAGALLARTPALAQGGKRDKALAKLGEKLGVAPEALEAVGAERYLSRRAEDRRALIAEIGEKHPAELLPLVVDAALHERDGLARLAAIRLLSVVGLEGGREAYLEHVVPALPELLGSRGEIPVVALDESNRLARWFHCEAEVAGLLERAFRSKNTKIAERALGGLLDLRNPELRDGIVARAIRQTLDAKSKLGVSARKRAILELGRRGGDDVEPAAIAKLMLADGTVAIECAQALADLGDPRVLPALRRVDATAAFALRIPAYEARARLGDEELFGELNAIFAKESDQIQRAVVDALRLFPTDKADRVLAKLSEAVTDARLLRTIGASRLWRGDPADLELLRARLEDADPDVWLARRVLAIDHEAADPLVVVVARSEHDDMKSTRLRAVTRLGERGIRDEATLAWLRKLQVADPSELRLRAAFALLQLGEEGGIGLVERALTEPVPPDPKDPKAEPAPIEVVRRRPVKTEVGDARRFDGSVLFDVFAALRRGRAPAPGVTLLADWIDPPGGAPPPRWLEHPFVRASAVDALGELAGRTEKDLAGAEPAERKQELTKLRDRAIDALAHALDDPAGQVRRFALAHLADRSGRADLPLGVAVEKEKDVLAKVRAWLEERGK